MRLTGLKTVQQVRPVQQNGVDSSRDHWDGPGTQRSPMALVLLPNGKGETCEQRSLTACLVRRDSPSQVFVSGDLNEPTALPQIKNCR
jgi:hypothetical protein